MARTPAQDAAIRQSLKEQAELRAKADEALKQIEPQPVVAESAPQPTQADIDEKVAAAAVGAVTRMFEKLFSPGTEDGATITWKRKLAAFFSVSLLALGAGTVIGKLTAYAMVGIFSLTGSAVLAWIVWVLGMLAALYAGYKIGQHVGNYVLSGQLDRDFVTAKNRVTGFFKREPKQLPAPAAA